LKLEFVLLLGIENTVLAEFSPGSAFTSTPFCQNQYSYSSEYTLWLEANPITKISKGTAMKSLVLTFNHFSLTLRKLTLSNK
jgi:hypothetical protein